ncbi:MAG: methyltransferase domain-containing protein, partial [bacterium]
MSWKNYKNKVVESRDLIIVPTLMAELTGLSGSGLDVGCGDGDLTNILSKSIQETIYGIDIDKEKIEEARKKNDSNVFIVGDLTRRAISKTGLRFKFAFSNCFLNHLDNPSAMACIDDMRSSLEKDAKVVIIIPHWRRADKNYIKPKHYPWGLTAVPEYGNRQYFRYGEWYCKALTDAG